MPEPAIEPPTDSVYDPATDPNILQIAGVLSTFPPHDRQHPQACIPMAIAVWDWFVESGWMDG